MNRRHTYLAAILALTIGYTVLHQVRFLQALSNGDFDRIPVRALYWVPLVILLYFWCKSDAKDRQLDLPILTSLLVPLFFPVGIPYYFLRIHDTRAALRRIAFAAFFVVGCVIAGTLAVGITNNYMLTGHLTMRWSGR